MDWKTLLAYISGSVDEELLLRNEYLAAENRILRDQLKGRVRLTNADRQTLAEIGKKLGKQALEEIAATVKPDTLLAWHRKFVARKSMTAMTNTASHSRTSWMLQASNGSNFPLGR